MPERSPAHGTDDLFSPGGFLTDSNLDSHPDDIRTRIVLEDEPDAEMWCALFDLAARLGLETSGFSPPLIVDDPDPERLPIVVKHGRSIRPHLVTTGWQGHPAIILEGADAIRDLTLRGHATVDDNSSPNPEIATIDLARLFESDGLLVDADGDEIPDGTRLCIMVPDELPRAVGIALFHFVARLAVEGSGIDLPVATTSPHPKPGSIPLRLQLHDGYIARLSVVDDPSSPSLELFGDKDDAALLLERLALGWPVPPSASCETQVSEIQDWLRYSLAGWTAQGRVAALIADLQQRDLSAPGAAVQLMSSNSEERQTQVNAVKHMIDAVPPVLSPGASQAIFTQDWSARWEVDRVLDVLHEDIIPELDRRLPLSLMVTVSEPLAVRRQLAERIRREFVDRGFAPERIEIQVLDAFKAGLCWLRETVLPRWKEITGIHHVSLRFRPLEIDDKDNALDLRIRWLQELFPGDEIVATELGLPLDLVELEEHQGAALYVASAFDEDGTLIDQHEFSPIWYRRPYHTLFPDIGSVHLVTGGIQAYQAGIELIERVPTDAERFWDYLQEEVLSRVQDAILLATGDEPTAKDQPFFDELFIELTISETDESFGIREERNSAAEALHEDIYFNVLDFVEALGKNSTGERLTAPGSIVPIVHVRPGMPPHARVQLRSRARSVARLESQDGMTAIGELLQVPPERPIVTSVSMLGEDAQLQFRWPSLSPMLVTRLKALSAVAPGSQQFPALVVSTDDGFQVPLDWPQVIDGPSIVPATQPVSDSQFLNEESLAEQLERLAQYPEVHVERALDRSYQGRPIPAVEVTTPTTTKVWSKRKLSIFKPTFLIVARHHANEVASTTAALKLVELMVSDNEWHRLLTRVNIVILPFENPDGAALHDRLQREHPSWKHHPARYNSVGYEFAEDSYNPDTPFGESRVRTKLWRRWLPDILVDNHGVPSHEWAQTFAGFGSPPRFNVSYWQVQAMIYGILYHLNDERYPEHVLAANAIRDGVARAVSSDIEMLQWNRQYRERYTTWGTRWVPERFPANTHRDMIFYFGAYEADSTRSRRSPAARFPGVTVASWVTEVPDETAHGDHLRLTAKAHLIANRATIDLLAASATPPERRMLDTATGTRVTLSRRRPIIIGS